MIKSLYTIVTVMVLIVAANSADYLWPTNAGKYLSSTFGEYRPGHFHSGIDIKTDQKTGYEVYAVDDGYIWRIRRSPYGYGKAVYLMLEDSNLAVYGHLEEFSEKIIPYVLAEQLRNNRYSIDRYFGRGEIPVKRGEVLGYTGDTGCRHPHLHFELRDRDGKPFNPLLTNLEVSDYTIPTVEAVAIVPLNSESRVDKSPKIRVFKARYYKNREFIIEDTINVSGPIGIEIKTYDSVRGIPNRYLPYGIKLFVDNELKFTVQYDKFDYSQTHLVDIDRDYQLMMRDNGLFNRLWTYDSTKSVPFYQSDKTGILNLRWGYHNIKIEVYDYNRNTSTLTMTLFSGHLGDIEVLSCENRNNRYEIQVVADSSNSIREFSAIWYSEYGIRIGGGDIVDVVQTADKYSLSISAPDYPHNLLEIVPKSVYGVNFSSIYLPFDQSLSRGRPDVEISYIHNPKTFICELSFYTVPGSEPEFFIQSGSYFKKIPLIRISPLKYVTQPVPLSWWAESFLYEVRVSNITENIVRKRINFKIISAQRGGTIYSEDGNLMVNFEMGSVYDSLLAWIDLANPKSIKGGEFESLCYTIHPLTQPLDNQIDINLKFPPYKDKVEQIGIYRLGEKKWEYIESKLSTDNRVLKAKSSKLGQFSLIRDFTPPIISEIFPGNGGKFKQSDVKFFKATVEDNLSGIKDDTSIRMEIDGEQIIPEYHGVQDYIKFKLPAPLSIGTHKLSITVIDRAMNVANAESIFVIV